MKIRTVIGFLSLLSGIGFIGLGGFVVVTAMERNSGDVETLRLADISCREQLVKVGNFIPKPDNVFEVIISDVSDPRRTMADITSIIAACPTKQVKATCIGTVCSPNGEPTEMRAVVTLASRQN